ncbi:MAG: adenylate/guanylate cyclase domain-containing protein, partial [Actinomycetota bacterium]
MGLRDWLGGGGDTVQDALLASGVGPDEIAAAKAAGTLELLAIERLVIADEPVYTLDQVAEQVDIPAEVLVTVWRALGFPDPRPDEAQFTDFDVDTLRNTAELVSGGVVDPDMVLQMTRVIGSSLSRVAAAQVGAMMERRRQLEAADEELGLDEPFEVRAGLLLETMPTIMDYVWRRHLEGEARRRLVQLVTADDGAPRTVGFADLVGFTAVAQQDPDHELAGIVDRFEALAYDVVARFGGRVIKMIGDEVMFVVDDARSGVEIGLTLAETYHGEEHISDVRVGVASGPVLEREGDLFGPTVNLASRIAGIAYPGGVVVSESVHDALAEHEELDLESIRAHTLKDIGRVPLWVARRRGHQRSLL